MLIIVEGQDRCGKTTLIAGMRRLIQTPKILIHHSGPPPKGVNPVEWSKKYYHGLITESMFLIREGWTVIADRSHYGETVYGPLFRNSTADYIWELDKLIDPVNSALVVLTDTAENIQSRDDGMSTGSSLDELNSVRDGFKAVYENSNIHTKILYDVSVSGWPDAKDILKRIGY